MYFTPHGLEQATRASVAGIGRGASPRCSTGPAGPAAVLDLGCGIGGDLLARARAGRRRNRCGPDPATAAVALANLRAFGLDGLARVRRDDATRQDPSRHRAVFADPGRRASGKRVFAPEAYQPPLETVLGLARRAPAGCVKVAPGIPYEAIPADAEAEWISDGGEVKEAALWLGELADGAIRRATVLRDGAETATLTADPALGPPPVARWRRYLYDPDGAVVRAHLVAEVAAALDGALADPRIAYVTSDVCRSTPFARAYEIVEVLPFAVRRLRPALRGHGIGTLTIKKRGFDVVPEELRKRLSLSGDEEATLVLTRVAGEGTALLVRPF